MELNNTLWKGFSVGSLEGIPTFSFFFVRSQNDLLTFRNSFLWGPRMKYQPLKNILWIPGMRLQTVEGVF